MQAQAGATPDLDELDLPLPPGLAQSNPPAAPATPPAALSDPGARKEPLDLPVPSSRQRLFSDIELPVRAEAVMQNAAGHVAGADTNLDAHERETRPRLHPPQDATRTEAQPTGRAVVAGRRTLRGASAHRGGAPPAPPGAAASAPGHASDEVTSPASPNPVTAELLAAASLDDGFETGSGAQVLDSSLLQSDEFTPPEVPPPVRTEPVIAIGEDAIEVATDGTADALMQAARQRRQHDDTRQRIDAARRKSGRRWAIGSAVLVLLLAATGVLLQYTPYGLFGMYLAEGWLPEAGSEAETAKVVQQAEARASSDVYTDVRRSLAVLARARQKHGLNRPLLVHSLLHEGLYQLRFGPERASATRAAAIHARLTARKVDTPLLALATAAHAGSEGDLAGAARQLQAAKADGLRHPYLHLVQGELALAQGRWAAAASAFIKAGARHKSGRAQYGLVRAYARMGAAKAAPLKALLLQLHRNFPAHGGVRAHLAALRWAEGAREEARRLCQAAGDQKRSQAAGAMRLARDARTACANLLGWDAATQQQWGRATRHYRAALALNPKAIVALLGTADLALRQGQAQAALRAWQQVVEITTDKGFDPAGLPPYIENAPLTQARLGMVRAHLALGQAQAAEKALQALPAAKLATPEAKLLRSAVLRAQGNGAEATQTLQQLIDAQPDFGPAYFALADLLQAQEGVAAARALLMRAPEALRHEAALPHRLGLLALDAGDVKQAVRWFEKALGRDEAHHDARLALARALRRLQRYPEATQALGQVARRDASFPGLALEQARLADAQGAVEMAAQAYKRALAAPVVVAGARVHYANFLRRQGRLKEAAAQLAVVLKAEPTSAAAFLARGRIAAAKRAWRDAQADYRKASELAPDNPAVYLALGETQLALGDLAAAIEAAKQALRLSPEQGEAFALIGAVQLRQGLVKDASSNLERALRLGHDKAAVHADLASCHEQLRSRTAAIESYERALERDPKRATWWYRIGQLQADKDRLTEARHSLGQAVKLGESDTKHLPNWLADAHRLLGDLWRRKDSTQARQHYTRFVELAPPDAIDLPEVRRRLRDLR
ncbi:MAG: tetratricopeptide repeat protein [Polyangiales bacterium]